MSKISYKEIIYLSVSSFLTALAVRLFFIEYSLTPGGITGLSITLSAILHLPIDLISLCISVPLLIVSYFFLGNRFAFKTIFVTITIPLFLRIVPQIHLVNNILLAAVIGGILVGISITIAIWNECATGGTDTIAYLIRHFFKNWELSKIIFVIDMIIVLSSFTISNKLYTSIYSAFSLIVIVITIHLLTKSKT